MYTCVRFDAYRTTLRKQYSIFCFCAHMLPSKILTQFCLAFHRKMAEFRKHKIQPEFLQKHPDENQEVCTYMHMCLHALLCVCACVHACMWSKCCL
jgi:hypothetical protein